MKNAEPAVVLDFEPNSIAAHLAGRQRVLLFGPAGKREIHIGRQTGAPQLVAIAYPIRRFSFTPHVGGYTMPESVSKFINLEVIPARTMLNICGLEVTVCPIVY